jgi:hypothetical protein
MAKNKDEDFVTFLNSAGETISNDPRYLAKKYLEEHGETEDNSEELEALRLQNEAKDAELESLRAQLAAAQATPAGVDDDAEEEDDADDEDEFSTMNGKELKAYAKENNVSIAGMTKVGEVRTALRAAKAAQA